MKNDIVKKARSKKIIILGLLAIIVISAGIGCVILYTTFENAIESYNEETERYNIVVEEYHKLIQVACVENIEGLENKLDLLEPLQAGFGGIIDVLSDGVTVSTLRKRQEELRDSTNNLLYDVILVQQITNPSEEWLKSRLEKIEQITEMQAVTTDHDPNGLLNVKGGYTSCIYFAVIEIEESTVKGKDLVEKGTDAGGAIEVYQTAEDAYNRCEYLSQFDNTLLYSGSYAIVGTMVIRTSYMLTNEQQWELTNKITYELTAIE